MSRIGGDYGDEFAQFGEVSVALPVQPVHRARLAFD
jgi:hypothetical protein